MKRMITVLTFGGLAMSLAGCDQSMNDDTTTADLTQTAYESTDDIGVGGAHTGTTTIDTSNIGTGHTYTDTTSPDTTSTGSGNTGTVMTDAGTTDTHVGEDTDKP